MTRVLLLLSLAYLLSACSTQEESNEGSRFNLFWGDYDTTSKRSGVPASSLVKTSSADWHYESPSENRVRVGVLLPNSPEKDATWQLIMSGAISEAKKLNIELVPKFSDNYEQVAQHKMQFLQLLDQGVDAIILASIHYRAMDDLVDHASKKDIPVVAMVNDIYAQSIAGKVMVSYIDMGKKTGEFVKNHAIQNELDRITVAFFPGPINAGFAPESLYGFIQGVRHFPGEFTLVEPQWGSPEPKKQREMVESVLSTNTHIDYIVGNGVAAVEAAELIATMGREEEIHVVSTYTNSAVKALIQDGKIAAAPSDQPTLIGSLSVQLALKQLAAKSEKTPFRISPLIPLCTLESVTSKKVTSC